MTARRMNPALLALAMAACAGAGRAAESLTPAFQTPVPAAGAASWPERPRPGARVAVPAANFLVEWRIQPAPARPSARGDVVITSGSATTGVSGFGPGAVVTGTARPAPAQALRVANGREGALRFDRSETHTVYDMSYAAGAKMSSRVEGSAPGASAAASAASATSGAGGGVRSRSKAWSQEREVQSHEVEVHRVDGLRVTPRWTQGDTLELDITLTHAGPTTLAGDATAGARAARELEFHSTVQASFDEWLTVATVGDADDELQIRVRRR